MYFETSRDILNITLSICAVVLTVFVVWGIYYCIMITKGILDVVRRLHETADRFERLVNDTKEKIESSFSALRITSDTVKAVFEYFSKRKSRDTFDG